MLSKRRRGELGMQEIDDGFLNGTEKGREESLLITLVLRMQEKRRRGLQEKRDGKRGMNSGRLRDQRQNGG